MSFAKDKIPNEDKQKPEEAEASLDIKQRVEKVREIQRQRFGSPKTNSEMSIIELKKYCAVGPEGPGRVGDPPDPEFYAAGRPAACPLGARPHAGWGDGGSSSV